MKLNVLALDPTQLKSSRWQQTTDSGLLTFKLFNNQPLSCWTWTAVSLISHCPISIWPSTCPRFSLWWGPPRVFFPYIYLQRFLLSLHFSFTKNQTHLLLAHLSLSLLISVVLHFKIYNGRCIIQVLGSCSLGGSSCSCRCCFSSRFGTSTISRSRSSLFFGDVWGCDLLFSLLLHACSLQALKISLFSCQIWDGFFLIYCLYIWDLDIIITFVLRGERFLDGLSLGLLLFDSLV